MEQYKILWLQVTKKNKKNNLKEKKLNLIIIKNLNKLEKFMVFNDSSIYLSISIIIYLYIIHLHIY
jgi:hypothetical protein